MSWKIGKLSDLADEIRDTYKPNMSKDLPCITLDNIEPGSLCLSSMGSSIGVQSNKYIFRKEDILFGTMRPYFRKVAKPNFYGVCSTEFSVIRPKIKDDNEFIFYFVAQQPFIDYATTNSKGDRPRTKWKYISQYSSRIPSQSIRKEIGDLLSKYDSLIQNNLRRIEILEESARLLYREWFVHLRFPGHEHTKITNGVPEGWEKGVISKFYNTSSGGTPSRKNPDFFNGEIKWVKTQELNNRFIIDTQEKITKDGVNKSSAKIFPKQTVLIAMYGATIGQLGILAYPSASNQACCALMPKHEDANYIYVFLFLKESKQRLFNLSMGSAQNNINQQMIKDFKMFMPSKIIMENFDEMLKPSFEMILNLQNQIELLKQARDILLPRLMNGDIAV